MPDQTLNWDGVGAKDESAASGGGFEVANMPIPKSCEKDMIMFKTHEAGASMHAVDKGLQSLHRTGDIVLSGDLISTPEREAEASCFH
jgi:hypothetical protein